MVACNNNACPLKKECQKHKKNIPESTVFTKHNFILLSGNASCDEFLYKSEPMVRLKKDGNPKKSGGLRSNPGGRSKTYTKSSAWAISTIKTLESLGYFFPKLWHIQDVMEIAKEMGTPFESVEDAKKVVAMLMIKFGGENFDSSNQISHIIIVFEITYFFEDRTPYDALVNI